jgi:uncharacterized membrane protein YgcG
MDAAAIVRELRSAGHALLPSVIPPEHVARLRDELDPETGPAVAACAAAHALPPADPLRYRSQIAFCPQLARWLAHGPLLEAARAVFNDQHVRVAEVEFFGKSRGAAAGAPTHRGFHTDWPHDPGSGGAVGAVSHPQPDVCMSLSTIWYLTDVSPTRGGTWTVPGSFKDRRNPRGPDSGMDDASAIATERQVTAPAGSVFVQDSRNWHSVPHNEAGDPRVCVIVRYAPAWMSVEFGQQDAVGYYGSNTAWLPRASWLAMPPPARELFRHRAEGERDVLQARKLLLARAVRAEGNAADFWRSEAECLAAEAPLPLQGSPALIAALRCRGDGEGPLPEVMRLCGEVQSRGFCRLLPLTAAVLSTTWEQQALDPEGVPPTAALLRAASGLMVGLADHALLLSVARSLLDMHIRIASARQVGSPRPATAAAAAASEEWSCAFPHAVGHSMGWVEAPFPPARMGLSVLCCCRCAGADGLSGHTAGAAEAVEVEVAVSSHHAQYCPTSSRASAVAVGPSSSRPEYETETLRLLPGEIVLLDTRTWRRHRGLSSSRSSSSSGGGGGGGGGSSSSSSSGGDTTVVEIVLCPWWVSCEFPRGGRGGGGGGGGHRSMAPTTQGFGYVATRKPTRHVP